MNRRQEVLKEVLNEQKRKYSFLFCIETGCIRFPHDADGHSTKVFAEELEGKGVLHSFEINQENIRIAKKVCKNYLNHIIFHLGNSLETLPKVLNEISPSQIHIAYLDSADDADLIFSEFKIVEPYLKPGSILVVDDITCKSCQKGKRVRPFLEKKKEWEMKVFDVANGMLVGRRK